MQAWLIAVSDRAADWAEAGYQDYVGRMRGRLDLRYQGLKLARRGKGFSDVQARRDESARLIAKVPAGGWRVALDRSGKPWSSRQLAEQLQRWQQDARLPCFLIGGPDGIEEADLVQCEQRWSLGALTLPHALARVVVAEQLYRAQCILDNHPYHR